MNRILLFFYTCLKIRRSFNSYVESNVNGIISYNLPTEKNKGVRRLSKKIGGDRNKVSHVASVL